MELTTNVHEVVKALENDAVVVSGRYHYWHYCCDGRDDRGWGCGYRTLQTVFSWLIHNVPRLSTKPVPSISEIQACLVSMGDKPSSFQDSCQWLGSVEVAMVLDQLCDIPCKLVHVQSGAQLQAALPTLKAHFAKTRCPVMMGGDKDASSKGIFGVSHGALLVVDPHYAAKSVTREILADQGWVRWIRLEEFCQDSFYNLCLPQVALNHK